MDNDDNGENTNRPPKPPYPEETDGLEETDNQEPEETNETDASVGESYDAMWKRATEMCNGPILEMWGCVVCPDGPKIDKGEEESAICNLCKNNMELPPLPMQCECCICSAINLYTDFAVQSQEFQRKKMSHQPKTLTLFNCSACRQSDVRTKHKGGPFVFFSDAVAL